MRKPEAQLRRARSLIAYWQGGQLHFRNYAQRSTISAKPITCELLDWFDNWRMPAQAIRHFSSYNAESVSSTLATLVRHGLLLRKNSAEARFDAELENRWSAWLPDGSLHFSTKDARYVKRQRSLAEWKTILPKKRAPPIFKSITDAATLPLPKPASPDSEFVRVLLKRQTHRHFSSASPSVEQVSQLLSLVWGVTGYLESPVFGRLLRKTSPSGGARHPGEVYLMALRVKGLARGLYHYHPGKHCLEKISANATPEKAKLYCASQKYARSAAALFIMTAVFERTMWKYPKSRAYRVVLLDAGHLAQTFCLVATWLGLAPFCTAALSDTMIEKDLGIDGIRESVLYVTGVGVPKVNRSTSIAREPEHA
jgi:SagB-type dehydrogenase family enzyme